MEKFDPGFDLESNMSTIGFVDATRMPITDRLNLGKSTNTQVSRLKPYKDVTSEYNTADDYRENEKLCLYDGFKFRSYDQEYIEWLIEDEQRELFKIETTLNPKNEIANRYKGRYLNIDIEIRYAPSGWVVDFSGSIHKLYNIMVNNGFKNYNNFYWSDFMKAYEHIIEVFNYTSDHAISVVNLEVGVNCKFPKDTSFTVPEINGSFLSFFNSYKNKCWISKTDRESFKVERGECYLKFYDKGIQNNLDEEIVRLELGICRARKIIKYGRIYQLSDMKCQFKHDLLRFELLKGFGVTHCHHPNFLQIPQFEIDAESDIYEFGKPTYWDDLKKTNRNNYNKKRIKHEQLIEIYFPDNPKSVLLGMLMEKILDTLN